MSEHAPGPWRWAPVTLHSMAGWDEVVLVDAEGSRVATLKPGAIGNPADARLIAAAPELYELVRWWSGGWTPTPDELAKVRALVERIRRG